MKFLRRLLKKGKPKPIAQTTLSVLVKNEMTVQSLIELSRRQDMPADELADELLREAIDRRRQNLDSEKIWNELTFREKQVVALIVMGYTGPQAASILSISVSTVKVYLASGYHKLGVMYRQELLDKLHGWDFEAWAWANVKNLRKYKHLVE